MKQYLISLSKHVRRCALVALSVLCVFISNAQISIAEQLEYVIYEEQDLVKGQELYNRITQEDINTMPDSVLFNYHYLGGYINSEIPNHTKAIGHLLEARKLCETKLGTHTIPYMEIMKGLGDEYNEIGETEKALQVFQEAIVKSMAAREYAGHAFGNLIIGVARCYEQLGWLNEIPNHYLDVWSFWNKDETPLVTYTYFPLWNLELFYRRYGMYDKAIAVSDKIIEFIDSKGGENHPELCDALYMRGNIFRYAKKTLDAINSYEKAVAVSHINHPSDPELLGMIYGNLACSYVNVNDFDNCDRICKLMETYYGTTNPIYYKNLMALGIQTAQQGEYDKALHYITLAEQGPMTVSDIDLLKWNKESITFNKEIFSHFADFKVNYEGLEIGTPEWFDNAHKLSCAYNLEHDYNTNLEVLKSMMNAITTSRENGSQYLLWVYNNLFNVYMELEQFDAALQYANERLKYIDSLGPIPDDSKAYYINCLNDVIVSQTKSGKIDGIDESLDRLKDLYLTNYGEGSKQYGIYLHNRGRAYQLQDKFDEAKSTYLNAIRVQNKSTGKPLENTVKYYLEVVEELGEI